jgi:hypothetical protein
LQRDCTLYAISERWRNYGTDQFQLELRQPRQVPLGFRKGNTLGKKKEATVTDDCCSTVTGNC